MRPASASAGAHDAKAIGATATSATAIGANIEILRRTLALLETLTDAQYAHIETALTEASIGAHVRHVLDHYRLFLEGLPAGEIDYDARERDTDIERSAEAAADEARRLITELAALVAPANGANGAPAAGGSWAARRLQIRQQGDYEPGRFDGCESHGLRELLFLQSHAVHHHALIALLARAQGLELPSTFGLAPSTATYLETTGRGAAARAMSAPRAPRAGPTCAR